MNEAQTRTYSILEEVISECKSNWISLSGGLDSSIIGHFIKNRDTNSLAIITKDFLGTDLTYSQIISKHLNIQLERKVSEEDVDAVDTLRAQIAVLNAKRVEKIEGDELCKKT